MKLKRLIALVLFALWLPVTAHAWWNDAWTLRKKITLDTQAAGIDAALDDVPVLVRLSTNGFDFLAAADDGRDIRFVADDDKTVLPHRIESYDTANELAFVWVRVPKLTPGNTPGHVWLYYGNEGAAATTDSRVHDERQWAVYSFSDGAGLPQDATGSGNHVGAGNLAYVANGLIGGAARLAGDGGLRAGGAALQSANGFTFSAWLRPERTDGEVLAYGGLALSMRGGTLVLTRAGQTASAPAPLAPNVWQHVAVTAAGTTSTLYVNGRPVASLQAPFSAADQVRIGAGLVGEIDEVQISTEARPAAWLAAQVESQGLAGRLVKLSADESPDAAGGVNYFTVTLNNLTVDGWVVVVICALMLLLALYVMFTKAIMLSRQESTNLRFGEAFYRLTEQLRAGGQRDAAHVARLDELASKDGEYRDSSLHRLFQVGVRELKSRLQAGADAPSQRLPAITQRALDALSATLDAQMTRERQRLDRGMVLLTIAISGGPFLGLLGTVVGVMITFAAVAVAGDVNVNSIAPGIAAALLATVAGLGVAIPSLFGYNYLQTKIKALSADMNVFADEFVTRMAETYGD